jgi:PadR family transcriptional regulator PadR
MAKGDFLGDFEQVVLLAILRLGKGAYGVAIRQTIEDIAGREVSIGSVYTTLDRLESKGLVSSRMAEPTAERGGRAKRFFTIESPGRSALQSSLRATRAMLQGLEPRWTLG